MQTITDNIKEQDTVFYTVKEERVMSKKLAIGISIILLIVLCVLIVCERKWPTAGTEIFMQMLPFAVR